MLKRTQNNNGMLKEPKIQGARQTRNIHDIPPDEVEEFDAIIQNGRTKLEIPAEPAMPCFTRKRIPTAKTQTQKVAVSKLCGRRPQAVSQGRLSLTKGKGKSRRSSPKRCILHKGGNHSQNYVADQGFHLIIGIILIFYTLLCRTSEDCKGRSIGRNITVFGDTPSLECLYFSSTEANVLVRIRRRQTNGWTNSQVSLFLPLCNESSVCEVHTT